MKPKNDRTQSGPARPPAPRKRFSIEKLEERVAPAKGGKGTNNCGGSVGSGASSGLSSSVSTIF